MLTHRLATSADIDALKALMALSIGTLQQGFLNDAQIAASRMVMGLDTQLIADQTYFAIEEAGQIIGCGGWSFRATLHGGDHSAALRNAALLDPAQDEARVRAMYTHPQFTRRGIGRLVLSLCEAAALEAGFSRVVLMATLSGEPLYRACGYHEIERINEEAVAGVVVPLIRMGKLLLTPENLVAEEGLEPPTRGL